MMMMMMMMMMVLGEQEGTLLALILSGERASLDTRGTRGLTRGLGTNVPETVTLNFRGFWKFPGTNVYILAILACSIFLLVFHETVDTSLA